MENPANHKPPGSTTKRESKIFGQDGVFNEELDLLGTLRHLPWFLLLGGAGSCELADAWSPLAPFA